MVNLTLSISNCVIHLCQEAIPSPTCCFVTYFYSHCFLHFMLQSKTESSRLKVVHHSSTKQTTYQFIAINTMIIDWGGNLLTFHICSFCPQTHLSFILLLSALLCLLVSFLLLLSIFKFSSVSFQNREGIFYFFSMSSS